MGIISYLLIIITFYLLSLASFPFILKLVLKYSFEAKNIHIKLKTPLKIKGIFFII